MEQLDMFQDVY